MSFKTTYLCEGAQTIAFKLKQLSSTKPFHITISDDSNGGVAIDWEYTSVGTYTGTLSQYVDTGKANLSDVPMVVMIPSAGGSQKAATIALTATDKIVVKSYSDYSTGTLADDILNYTFFELKIYS